MRNKKIFKQGFTLLELLVVVAIIGILSAIVIVALDSSKKSGDDSAVKSNLHTIANEAGIFYTDNGNSYLPVGASDFLSNTCLNYKKSVNMFSRDPVLAAAIEEAVKRGNGSACYNSANSWSVVVGLKLKSNTFWCVDSGGIAKEESGNSAYEVLISRPTYLCE